MGSKPSKPMPWAVRHTNAERMAAGQKFLSFVWRDVATKVVETAIRVYGLSPEQAAALRSAFLTRVVYSVDAS